MKKIYLLLAVGVGLVLSSCSYEPHASFNASTSVALVGETVYFDNDSYNADYYEWDFGDGTFSNNYNAHHTYIEAGYYTVTLRAYEDDFVSTTRMTIEVIEDRKNIEFTANTAISDVGYIINFTNYSSGADSYEWDFGDGSISTTYHASHVYNHYGVYTVALNGFKNNRNIGTAYLEVEIAETVLQITVRDYETDDLITFIPVTLFDNYSEWYNIENPVVTGETNRYGVVEFVNVLPIEYYVDVNDNYYTNDFLADEDINNITTAALAPGYINTFTAYVDYAPVTGMKAGRYNSQDKVKFKIKQINRDVSIRQELIILKNVKSTTDKPVEKVINEK